MIVINETTCTEYPQKGPIFVISLERSGSTLLRNLLDVHPAVFAPAQLNIGHLCHWIYRASYYSIAQVYTDLQEDERQSAAIEETRDAINRLMHGLASKKNKTIWCDKSTMNINNLDILRRVFLDGRFICLYRNCLDYVHSYISVCKLGFYEEVASYIQKKPTNFVSAIGDSWIDRTSAILDFESSDLANCYRVTYESLVFNTVDTLKGVFEFLELKWDDGLLDRAFSSRGKGPLEGDIKFQFSSNISTDSVGHGARIPLTYIRQSQKDRINSLLSRLGYPSIGLGLGWLPGVSNALQRERGPMNTEPGKSMRDLCSVYFANVLKKKMDNCRALNCTCKILVSGDGGGVWILDLTKPGGEIREGDADTICTIGLSSEVLQDLVLGNIQPLDAFCNGLVGASGDIRMAVNFGRLLFG